jgi:hypothetical protein
VALSRPVPNPAEATMLQATARAMKVNYNQDPIIQKMIEDNPLMLFSIYTQIQFYILRDIRVKILDMLDKAFKDSTTDNVIISGEIMNELYGYFWLWVLGAYEIVRTMAQRGSCFDSETHSNIVSCKKYLSAIRIPFAKQELEGPRNVSIESAGSIYGICAERRDLSFMISNKEYYMRDVMQKFSDIMSAIRPEDIKRDLRSHLQRASDPDPILR